MSIFINNEEVKVCPNYPNYGASSEGNIYRLSTKKFMSKIKAYDGYLDVRVCHNNIPKSVKYHVVVADAWLPYEEGKDFINHINGDKSDSKVSNLERCTGAENQRHAIKTGLKSKAEDLYNSLLTNENVHDICKLLSDGITVKSLSEMYGVSKDVIRKIKDGSNYHSIRKLYLNIPHKYKYEFSESTIRWVCEQIVAGVADNTIAKSSNNKNLSSAEVKRIRHKIRYKIISDEYFID